MGLVQVQICLVLLLDLHDLLQLGELAFHRIDTLDDDDDLLPRPPSAGLALGNARTQQALQLLRVVVCENLHFRARATHPTDDGCVIEGVRDEQRALLRKNRNQERVCRKAHAARDTRLLAQKVCHLFFQLTMHRQLPGLGAGRGATPPVGGICHVDPRSAVGVVRRKSQVVVRTEVQTAGGLSRQLKWFLAVYLCPVHNIHPIRWS
mmetsp:Transcript_2162/g.6920  ORF Transcript_2162/g.6920 Transcript_2162/m.6920 type:complete len:207 (+) Transcript_2162:669-1289(+)